ncbi:MAG: SRPBCC domain-containing protein [Myxococcota bacterium]
MDRSFPPGDPSLISRTLELGERDGVPVYIATTSRPYATTAADLWDALSNPERLKRWFLPVTGDLVEGGRYQFEGNAGGTITACIPNERVEATWEFGGGVSWITVTIASESETTAVMTLVHTSPIHQPFWDQYGPGATGIGWDLALDGAAMHFAEPGRVMDETEFISSEAGLRFIATSSAHWRDASIAAGTDAEQAKQAADRSTAFFSGLPEPDQ